MGGFDLGPEWMWNLMFAMAGIGVIASVVGLIWLAAWLLCHVKFV